MEFINPREGAQRLGQLLGRNGGPVAVLPIRWSTYAAGVPEQGRRWLDELVDTPTRAQAPAQVRTLRDVLEESPPGRRSEMLMDGLTQMSRSVLGIGAGVQLPKDAPLRDMGLDSLMAVELRNLLAKAGRAPLPVTLLFDYPTLDALSGYLAKAWGFGEARAIENARPVAAEASAEIDALSDTEIEDLLRSELSLARGPQ
jgi:hypothetical protein